MIICAVLVVGLAMAADWFIYCVIEPILNWIDPIVEKIHRQISKKYRLEAEERERREEEARLAAERSMWIFENHY